MLVRRRQYTASCRCCDLFLHSFQSQRTGRARQSLCRNQKAMICPISKRFLRYLSFNPPPSSRLVSPSCRAYPAGSGKASICRSMLPNRRRFRWLDSLQLSRVDFIKIDVEGHELDVLHGSQKILLRHRPTLMVEVTSSRTVNLLCDEMGYRQPVTISPSNQLFIHSAVPSESDCAAGNSFPTLEIGSAATVENSRESG